MEKILHERKSQRKTDQTVMTQHDSPRQARDLRIQQKGSAVKVRLETDGLQMAPDQTLDLQFDDLDAYNIGDQNQIKGGFGRPPGGLT